MMIEFDLEWYGTYNRRSAVCDFLELMAIAGHGLSLDDLRDVIWDQKWRVRLRETMEDGESSIREPEPDDDDTSLGPELEECANQAADILMVLTERAQLLGPSYPFVVRESPLVEYTGDDPQASLYTIFLAISVAHGAGLDLARRPAYLFEDSLSASLSAYGLATACLGAFSREERDFPAVAAKACAAVGLGFDGSGAPYRRHANEEGSDTISNVWRHDPRPGGLQILGQAHVGRSDDWKQKLNQPPRGKWEEWLGRWLQPASILAVPHHVQSGTFAYLVTTERDRDVVDRLRLARIERDVLDDERALAELVYRLDVEHLAAS